MNNTAFEVIVSDMDGTLLNNEHMITTYTMEILKQLVLEKSIILVLATGRNYFDVRNVFDTLRNYFLDEGNNDYNNDNDDSSNSVGDASKQTLPKVNKSNMLKDRVYLITSNGAVVHDAFTRQVVYTRCIDPVIAERLYRLYEKNETTNNIDAQAESNSESTALVNTHCYQHDDWFCTLDWTEILAFHAISGMKYILCPHPPPSHPCYYYENKNNVITHNVQGVRRACVSTNTQELLCDDSDNNKNNNNDDNCNEKKMEKEVISEGNVSNGYFGDVSKVFYAVRNSDYMSEVLKRVHEVCSKDEVHITQSEAHILDVVATGVNKGSGLRHLFEYIYYKDEREEQKEACIDANKENASYRNEKEADKNKSISSMNKINKNESKCQEHVTNVQYSINLDEKTVAMQSYVEKMLGKSIAFGDEANDVEMLQLVGKGCVMGNASARLRDQCPCLELVGINNENGVARKLAEVFCLSKKQAHT